MTRLRVLICCFIIPAAAWQLPAATHRPQFRQLHDRGPVLRFDADSVTAAGLSAGTTVYFAATSLSDKWGDLSVVRSSGIVDNAQGADEARFAVPGGVRRRGIWIVVDSKGGYSIAAPPGFPLREFDLGPGNFVASNGALKHLSIDRNRFDIYVLRPGTGFWRASVKDGVANDADGKVNGSVKFAIASLMPLAGSPPPPDVIKPDDVVVGIDLNSFEFFVSRVGK